MQLLQILLLSVVLLRLITIIKITDSLVRADLLARLLHFMVVIEMDEAMEVFMVDMAVVTEREDPINNAVAITEKIVGTTEKLAPDLASFTYKKVHAVTETTAVSSMINRNNPCHNLICLFYMRWPLLATCICIPHQLSLSVL